MNMLLALIATLSPCVLAAEYRSTSVDQSGSLHIVLDNGKEILPTKMPDQVSFGNPSISPDRRTAGWLVLYPDPGVSYYRGAELPGKLVIYRAGRVLHTFTAEQMFYDWQFQDGGRRVAYCTGPTHGGAAGCVLRDVNSGRTLARWVATESTPPAWAKTLHR
jgi:hypothetical protein